jgi:hypothetical protein
MIGSARQHSPLEHHKVLFSKEFASFSVAVMTPVPVGKNRSDFAASDSIESTKMSSQWVVLGVLVK